MPSFTRRTRQAFVLALILCAATANAADRSEFHTSFEAGEPALLPHASDTSFHIEIAGGPSKFVHLGAADCGCGDDEGQKKTSRSRQTASQSDLDELYGTSPSAPGAPPLPPPHVQPFPAL